MQNTFLNLYVAHCDNYITHNNTIHIIFISDRRKVMLREIKELMEVSQSISSLEEQAWWLGLPSFIPS